MITRMAKAPCCLLMETSILGIGQTTSATGKVSLQVQTGTSILATGYTIASMAKEL